MLLSNFIYIFVTNPDPLVLRSGLPVENSGVPLNLPFYGGNSIEGNDGITKQALGVQANEQLFNGKLPLWNHYEGIGMPLLGETQSAALFPFTMLLSLPHGLLINEIVLEIIAGIGAYLFIRRLKNKKDTKIDNVVAITGGLLFATLGTFMMLPNACFNPIAFLPWSLLGVDLIFSSNKKFLSKKNVLAMLVFSLSIIFALNSGFPETAYINTILVFIYTAVLFIKTKKNDKLVKFFSLAAASLLAIMISLPWIFEFFTFINPANGASGIHDETILNGLKDTPSALLSFIPNAIGYDESNPSFGGVGGYFMISGLILALFAICNKNIKLWHKILFGGWFLIGFLRIIGVPIVSILMSFIPMLGSAAVYRYIPPSMSLCLIVLACLGLNQLLIDRKANRKIFAAITGFAFLFYGFILFYARHLIKDFILSGSKHALFATFFIELSVFACVLLLVAIFSKWKHKKIFICLVLSLESLICFSVWQLGAESKTATVDTRGVEFLQQNLGVQRFESNVLWPNYGSYFSISQLSMKDLPMSALWADYIAENLDSYDASIGFLSNKFDAQRIEQDKFLGVKYLFSAKGSLEEDFIKEQGLTLAYQDDKTEIFEIPDYRKYLSGDNCIISETIDFNRFTVNCDKNSKLTRLELFYPGWHATVDGETVEISMVDGLFQQIDIDSGEHQIEFYYWPKHMNLALIGAGTGLLVIVVATIYAFVPDKKNKKIKK